MMFAARKSATGTGNWALTLWYVAMVLFLFAPILVAIVYAFNEGVVGKQVSTFTGFTFKWFPAAWHDGALRNAVVMSLKVAFWAALISVVMGAALGYSIVRQPSQRVRSVLAGLAFLLLVVPETVMGVALLLFFAETGVQLSSYTLIAGITPVSIAVVAMIVRARMLTFDRRMEEAAADLGASAMRTFSLILLPQLAPALGSGLVMAYTFAFDNLMISTFLTTPQTNTLPVYLYGSLHYGPSPEIYAAAVVVFFFVLVLLAIAGALMMRVRQSPTVQAG